MWCSSSIVFPITLIMGGDDNQNCKILTTQYHSGSMVNIIYKHLSCTTKHFVKLGTWVRIREPLLKKKMFSFGHCPNYLPPPLPPFRATFTPFSAIRGSIHKTTRILSIPTILILFSFPNISDLLISGFCS